MPSLPTECSRRGVKKRRVGCPDTLKNMAALLEALLELQSASTPPTNVHATPQQHLRFAGSVSLVHQQPRVGECRRNVEDEARDQHAAESATLV